MSPRVSAPVIGTSTTAEPCASVKRSVRVAPLPETESSPLALANGATISSCAVSPGRYVSLSGTTVALCWSTPRVGTVSAPLTHRVNSLRLRPPASSVTTAEILY